MIMPANNLSGICHYYAGIYPGKIGMLNTPFSYKKPPGHFPFALDNGCFTRWDEKEFFLMIRKVKLLKRPPIFCPVPDVVADAEATNIMWEKYHDKIPFRKAFVVQDGHEPQDVPKEAGCVFVGGSVDWKIKNAEKFRSVCMWLHIGRVNSDQRLLWAEGIGADSVDGTGFFRSKPQRKVFKEWFEGKEQQQWV